MNRQAKRMMQRQKATGPDRLEAMQRRQRVMQEAQRKKRTPPREFLKQVRAELKKVAWPTRAETINYSTIVLITLVVLITLIFILDTAFAHASLWLFK